MGPNQTARGGSSVIHWLILLETGAVYMLFMSRDTVTPVLNSVKITTGRGGFDGTLGQNSYFGSALGMLHDGIHICLYLLTYHVFFWSGGDLFDGQKREAWLCCDLRMLVPQPFLCSGWQWCRGPRCGCIWRG
jgi:hypothetical protein